MSYQDWSVWLPNTGLVKWPELRKKGFWIYIRKKKSAKSADMDINYRITIVQPSK